MASERPQQAPRKMVTMAKGKPWSRQVDAELLRLREGSVDEHGMRRITMTKQESMNDNMAEIRRRKAQGYEVAEEAYQYVFSMPQEKWKSTVEAKQHEEGLSRMKNTQKLDQNERRDLLPEMSSLTQSPDPITGPEVMAKFFD